LSHVLVGSVDLRVGPSLIDRSNLHGLVIQMALNHGVRVDLRLRGNRKT
jgi:hypothetical protein